MINYRISNHRIEIKNPHDGKFYDYCEEIAVTEVMTDLLEGSMEVEIVIYTSSGKTRLTLPRGDMNRKVLPRLIDKGLTVIDNNDQADFILQVLFDSEKTAVVKYRHKRLGFYNYRGKQIFLAHHPIGLRESPKAQSEYAFPEITRPVGSFQTWQSFVRQEVLGKPYLELALALGAVAPIAHLLKEGKELSLIPIFCFAGRSSTGKTTTLKMIASMYGSPTENSGMLSDLNATQNAFFAQLNNRFGMPALIDETSSVPEWDFGKVLYNLPKGREKLRCDSKGKIETPATYSGCIIFTGERSLLEQCSDNNGLRARLIEFSLPWTTDANHAARIEKGCLQNYGTAVEPLLLCLFKNPKGVRNLYRKCCAKLKEIIQTADGVEDRLIKLYALILTAGVVVRSALGLELHIMQLKKLLIEQYRNNSYVQNTKNYAEVMYDYIKQQVLSNCSHFPKSNNVRYQRSLWGIAGAQNERLCVWIAEQHFRKFLQDAKGYAGVSSESDKAVMKMLYDKGWLMKYGDRYLKEESIGTIKTKCYCLFLQGTDVSSSASKSRTKRSQLV